VGIQLFNGAIPLIALKMTAYKIGGEYALTFVKVLDEITYGLVDEDEPVAEPTDRAFWEKRGSKKTLALTDDLLKLVNEVERKAVLKYNKHCIGLAIDGAPFNFVTFVPRKAHVIMPSNFPRQTNVMCCWIQTRSRPWLTTSNTANTASGLIRLWTTVNAELYWGWPAKLEKPTANDGD
jgi:hypothetical protein